jgi:hypothetical protein
MKNRLDKILFSAEDNDFKNSVNDKKQKEKYLEKNYFSRRLLIIMVFILLIIFIVSKFWFGEGPVDYFTLFLILLLYIEFRSVDGRIKMMYLIEGRK